MEENTYIKPVIHFNSCFYVSTTHRWSFINYSSVFSIEYVQYVMTVRIWYLNSYGEPSTVTSKFKDRNHKEVPFDVTFLIPLRLFSVTAKHFVFDTKHLILVFAVSYDIWTYIFRQDMFRLYSIFF
jgi:hypothetical protein